MLKISRDAHPTWRLCREYEIALGKPVPRGVGYAVSTGQISQEERDRILRNAIDTNTPIEGYDLLVPGDPGVV